MVSRRQMTAIEHFDELSPEVGELDEHVMDRLLADSPDEAVSLLVTLGDACLLYTSPSPRDSNLSRMPSSA